MNFVENSRRYSRINVYHRCHKLFSGVNDTGEKFIAGVINLCHGFSVIAGVVDTGEQFIAGDNDSGDKFIAGDNDTGEQLSPVTTTLAINLLPVTRTRTPWRRGAAKDKRKLKGINRRYLPTHLDQRPLRPPKLNNAILV